MDFDIYTPVEMYAIMFDQRQTVSTSQWRRLFTTRRYFSDQEQILFDKISDNRRIAPFMLPNVAGRPIYRAEGERIMAFTPAYTKPKDAVLPGEALAMTGPEVIRRIPLQTPQARFDQAVVRIANYHRSAIERLWDFMVAKALIDGELTIKYMTDNGLVGREVVIDYERNAAHRVVLAGGARWGQAGVNIFDLCQQYIDIVGNAEFGGVVTNIMLGADAARAFMASQDVIDRLSTQTRGSEEIYINRGIIRTDPLNPFTYLGTLGSGVDVWRVSGPGNQFQQSDGTFEDILPSTSALFVAPSVEMVEAYGAIQEATSLVAQDLFVKMFDQDDPSARFVLSQSAPLAIPVNPNATLHATVG